MYLDYYGFKEYPFTLTPNTEYFCLLPQYREALNVLLLSIKSGEGFIKVVGDVGTGKTMLCHALLASLNDNFITAYISNPSLDYAGLLKALVYELKIDIPEQIDHHVLLNLLKEKLLELDTQGKRVIIMVDEAQILSDQAMEGLRLLSNLETSSHKLLQILLFGQTELDQRLRQKNLRQLRQRIAFSYQLKSLNKEEVKAYVEHRLIQAGNRGEFLFSKKALSLLSKLSRGNPRIINILCHKSLMAAFGRGARRVKKQAMKDAIADTQSIAALKTNKIRAILSTSGWVLLITLVIAGILLMMRSLL